MANNLEQLIYDLPVTVQQRIFAADCTMSDCYCESIDFIGEYIDALETIVKNAGKELPK